MLKPELEAIEMGSRSGKERKTEGEEGQKWSSEDVYL